MNKYKIKLKLFKHPVWALCVMYVHVCETLYRDKYVYLLFCMCVSMLGSVFGVRLRVCAGGRRVFETPVMESES